MKALIVLAVVSVAASPALADHKYGRQVRYVGPHPIPKSEGGGMCYIEGPHVHIYAANKLEYRVHDGDEYFVGDPVAYGWDGPRYAYKGPHPIHVDAVVGGPADVEYCYITGPHYHYYAPADGDDFKLVGGAYFYVGTPPPAFVEARPTYIGINDYYTPIRYDRPVVTVAPPEGWIGVRAEYMGPAVVVAPARAEVVAPGVHVEGGIGIAVPVPTVQVGIGVQIGGPAVIVHDHPGPVIIEDHGHHDHGRHEGWHRGHR